MSETEQEPVEQTEPEPVEPVEKPETEEDAEEASEPVEEPAEPQETVQEPVGASEQEMERVSKAMDRAAKAYVDKTIANLGNDLSGWQACPCCSAGWPGLVMPIMPSPEVLAQIKTYIGEPATPPYKDDPHSTPCHVCDGWGNVTTHSHVANRGVVMCLECKGRGYVSHHAERDTGAITAGNGAALPPVYNQQAPPAEEPPEVARLKDLGYIVVEPVAPPA